VFVASLAGLVGAPTLVAYTTTKFAVVGFAEALRLELAGSGVGVTTVCPGFVRTNFAKSTRYERSPLASFLDHAPGWYGLSKERVARALVDAVVQRRPLVVLGPERVGWWLKRLAPEAAFTLTSWVVRRAGLGGARLDAPADASARPGSA
jgi:short-subunit dehydrogenase